MTVQAFANFFSSCYSCNSVKQQEQLEGEYLKLRQNYVGLPCADITFDTELISKTIFNLKCGKAADIDSLSNEHLLHSHPIVSVILSRLFMIIHSRYIPAGFKMSYIVPIPKLKDARSKALTCNDFRGIAISPVISKLFEYCFLDRFRSVFATESNQFGFKKALVAPVQFILFDNILITMFRMVVLLIYVL